MKFLFYSVIILSVSVILYTQYRSGHMLKGIILSALQGISALFAVNIIGGFIGVHINVNAFSLLAGSIASTPAVILMLLLDIII